MIRITGHAIVACHSDGCREHVRIELDDVPLTVLEDAIIEDAADFGWVDGHCPKHSLANALTFAGDSAAKTMREVEP